MRSVFLILILFLCCMPAVSADRPLIITSALSAQPDAWVKDGRIVGASVELMKLIFNELDISIESKVQPWARSLKDLERGTVDANLTIFYTDERAKYIVFSEPYAVAGTFVFTKRGNEFAFKSWNELIGKKGGVIRGDIQNKEFNYFAQKNLDLFPVDTIVQVQRMLIAGRVDYALYSKNPFIIEAKKNHLLEEISLLPIPISSENVHIGLSKNSPFVEYVPLINEKILQYKEDGTLKKLTLHAIYQAAN